MTLPNRLASRSVLSSRFAGSLLLCLLVLTGCTRAINRSAERRIRDALPDLLGSARQYRVHVANAPERTVQGHLAEVVIDGDDVQLSTGLLLDKLHLDLKDVDIDTNRHQVRSIREASFAATVGQNSLDEFLAGEAPSGESLRNTRVTLGDNNRVTIASERVVLGVGVPFRLTGPLRLAGSRIEIDPTRLTVVGISLTGTPLRFLKQRFETGIDLSALAFPVRVTGVQTARGSLTLTGTADVAAVLHQTQTRQK